MPPKVEHVFGGQYMWVAAAVADGIRPDMADLGGPFHFPAVSEDRQRFVDSWRRRLAGARGPAAIWGAGAKGVMFCTLVDPDASRISGVVDINPAKHDKFIPTTGHHVGSPETLRSLGAKTVIVMNPNYAAEVGATLREMGLDADLLVLGEENV